MMKILPFLLMAFLLIALSLATTPALAQPSFKYDPLGGQLFVEPNGVAISTLKVPVADANIVSVFSDSLPGAGACFGSDCWTITSFNNSVQGFDTTITAPGGPLFTLENETQSLFATLLTGLSITDFGLIEFATPTAGDGTDEIELGTFGGSFDPGDFDEDGDVDADDLADWQSGFGTTGGSATVGNGNADADSDVDGADFLIWQRNFTGSPGVQAATSVPEPTTIALVSLSMIFLAGSARNRRDRV